MLELIKYEELHVTKSWIRLLNFEGGRGFKRKGVFVSVKKKLQENLKCGPTLSPKVNIDLFIELVRVGEFCNSLSRQVVFQMI